jgi:Lhr-like helicase
VLDEHVHRVCEQTAVERQHLVEEVDLVQVVAEPRLDRVAVDDEPLDVRVLDALACRLEQRAQVVEAVEADDSDRDERGQRRSLPTRVRTAW